MKELKEQDVFVKVSPENELPSHQEDVFTILNTDAYIVASHHEKFGWNDQDFEKIEGNKDFPVTVQHWLKPTPGYLIQEEDLIELLNECFGAGSIYRSQDITGKTEPTFDEFLNSKGLK